MPEPDPRRDSAAGRLARLGFVDLTGAMALLRHAPAGLEALLVHDGAGQSVPGPELERELLEAADPDLALAGLVGVARQPHVVARLVAESALRRSLLAVCGVSEALGTFLGRHPDALDGLSARPQTPESLRRGFADVDGLDSLRVAYRRLLLGVVSRDLAAEDGAGPVRVVGAELAALADATLVAAARLASADLPAGSAPCRLAVLALGKCGGDELNYVSDVDVVFVAEPIDDGDPVPALRTAAALAVGTMRACSAITGEGSIWEVDAGLRPEGGAGPLVRSLASHVAYYERWARTWEFQALLKARPAAGDLALGAEYVRRLSPLIWSAGQRPGFVSDVQAMRRRVEAHVPPAEVERQLKLGPGGLRDVEFAVQLLQLVHGRDDPTLHSRGTLDALAALAEGGYVGREDAAALAEAYQLLRTLEHRMQLHQLRRTSLIPDTERDLRRLGRALGFRTDPAAELLAARRKASTEVRRLHEKLFYRPLLTAVARLGPGEARLTPAAAADRLEALGYADPQTALHHLAALTAGMSRSAAIQRTLLPVLLGWFADAPDPDAGLLTFRRVSEALGGTSWFLRVLRDEGALAQRMAKVLASSRYAAALLLRAPETLPMLGEQAQLRAREPEQLRAEMSAAVRRYDEDGPAAIAARAVRRRELFRTAAADVLFGQNEAEVGESLTEIAGATLAGALEAASRSVAARHDGVLPVRIAVIGMGRLGGAEMSYASDADVLFVCDPVPGAAEEVALRAAYDIANELRRTLALPAPDPPLLVDCDLRPEGRQGPLVRTLASYAAYYARWAHVWERQALLRAVPVAGDAELGARFVTLVDPLRYPEGGLDEAAVREVRRIKARVEAERLPRGADPAVHLKLGPGGLADVEWTVQLLQLRHAGVVPGLRTTRTLPALTAACAAGLITDADAAALEQSWRLASRLRNALTLLRGKPSDSLPANVRELGALAQLLGHPRGAGVTLVEDYRRVTRRARTVVQRVFYEG